MIPTTGVSQLGTVGWLALLALLLGTLARLIKSDLLNTQLQKLGLPALPKVVVPWVVFVVGFLSGAAEAKISGRTWSDSALMGFWGVISGGTAIAGHESLEKPLRTLLGDAVGNLLFGKGTPNPDAKEYGSATPEDKIQAQTKKAVAAVTKAEEKIDEVVRESQPPPPPSTGTGGVGLLTTLCLAAAMAILPGCAAFAAAIPIISEIAVAVNDGSQILSAVQVIEQTFFLQHPDPQKQKAVQQAELDARLALALVLHTSETAKDINDKDMADAIIQFQKAYTSLMELLKQLGAVDGQGKFGVQRGSVETVVHLPEPRLMKLHPVK